MERSMPRPLFPVPLGQTKIFLYAKDVDMRKSFDGLHALIQSEFRRDVRQGDLFLFLNRRLDRIKLMHWDTDGLVIWMKRLERGTFQRPRCPPDAEHVVIDATDLAILLAGIELTSVKRRRRYTLDRASCVALDDASRSALEPSRS
jgi:transposase